MNTFINTTPNFSFRQKRNEQLFVREISIGSHNKDFCIVQVDRLAATFQDGKMVRVPAAQENIQRTRYECDSEENAHKKAEEVFSESIRSGWTLHNGLQPDQEF